MKEGGTGLHKTIREMNLVYKGLIKPLCSFFCLQTSTELFIDTLVLTQFTLVRRFGIRRSETNSSQQPLSHRRNDVMHFCQLTFLRIPA